jgi:tetratricopeptide (TPR) repeat protein
VSASVSKADFDALQAMLAQGRLQGALAVANRLLEQHPDPFSQSLMQGLALLAQGKSREAYASFFQASTLIPADARSYLGIAQSLFQLGHFQKAIAAGQQALRLDPADWQPVLVIADALAAMEQWAQAIEQYNAILAMGVRSGSVHLGLGSALLRAGRLADAQEEFTQALRLEPDRAAGYCNLGNACMAAGQYREAIEHYRQALSLTPDALVQANLAYACLVMGDFTGAEAESRRAIAHDPNFAMAHGILADALRKLGRDSEAVPHFLKHGTPESAGRALEVLFQSGDMAAFEAAQQALSRSQPDNIRLATVSVQAAARYGPRYASRFCADPLKYIGVTNLLSTLAPFEAFAGQVLSEAKALDAVWEPPAKTTKGGFQTEGDLFSLATPGIARLRAVIGDTIEAYFASHAGSLDRYVTHRPRELLLKGWVVRLRRSGRQDMHIHPDGWLSGVLYAKLPPRTGTEGAIGFSLSGRNAGPLDHQYQPRLGDLVLFPSSLFHATVPFSADEERISIAFDLLPQSR